VKNKNVDFDCNDCEFNEICHEFDLDCIYQNRNNSIQYKLTRPIEMFLSIVLTLYGFILLLPYHTLQSHGYDIVLSLAREEVWGTVCFSLGIIQFLVINLVKIKFIKALSLAVSAFVWSFIGSMFLVNDIIVGTMNTACTTYLSLAGLSFYTAYRLR
jgi:hypothetical protein